MPTGSKVRALVLYHVSLTAIPPGTTDGLGAGIDFLLKPDALRQAYIAAGRFVRAALDAVKRAPDNPWGDDDEAIAADLVRRIEEKLGRELAS